MTRDEPCVHDLQLETKSANKTMILFTAEAKTISNNSYQLER
jgi:hypothetical protein